MRTAWAALALAIFFPGSLGAAIEFTACEMNVADLPRAISFYTDVLQFRKTSIAADDAHLLLGQETLILHQPKSLGRSIPRDLPPNDISFEHLAIVVGDIDAAFARLQQHHVRMVSAGVQTLPSWNFDSANIRALYFRDPDGHFLELIQFPSNKGEPRWRRPNDQIFLGIDHSAIVVRQMKASVHFYRDLLGFTVIGNSFNYGGEQELLSGVPGARVRITSLRGAKGPGIELLQYEAPGSINRLGEVAPNDLSHWEIHLLTTRSGELGERRDPYGHALVIAQRPALSANLDYARDAFVRHWSRYLMEGAELGIFMAVALFLALVLEHPQARLHRAIKSPLLRRFIYGLGIGLTVIILIYCQWGRQSGAQFNPSVTLSMLYLRRIPPWDALFYIIAQFIGGWLGVVLVAAFAPKASAHKKVNYVVTEPGKPGVAVAFIAEFVISFILFGTLRAVYQSDLLRPSLGYFAGVLLCLYITFEAPFSGMSLNPARSVASAIPACSWKAMWIYFVAPPLAMLLAAVLIG